MPTQNLLVLLNHHHFQLITAANGETVYIYLIRFFSSFTVLEFWLPIIIEGCWIHWCFYALYEGQARAHHCAYQHSPELDQWVWPLAAQPTECRGCLHAHYHVFIGFVSLSIVCSIYDQAMSGDEVGRRTFHLHLINDSHKTVCARAKVSHVVIYLVQLLYYIIPIHTHWYCDVFQVIDEWCRVGGVLLMGYEMFRLLATRKTKTRKRKANSRPEVIDIDLEEKNDEMKVGELNVISADKFACMCMFRYSHAALLCSITAASLVTRGTVDELSLCLQLYIYCSHFPGFLTAISLSHNSIISCISWF